MLEAQGFKYPEDINVLDPNKYGAGVADEGLYINDAYLAKNPNVPLCIIRATRAGFAKAIADPKLGEAAVKKYTPGDVFSDNDIKVGVEETIKYATLTPEGKKVEPMTIDMAYIRDSAEKLRKYGVVKRDVNVDDMVLTEPLEQADASPAGGTSTQ
jgi:ABC-type nitrate/sulfonate/bicarbonate transport system substrate-binding protein